MADLYVNEFCIGLHSQCNWSCPYCIAKNNNIPYTEADILEQIEPIKHMLGNVFLSGGEPGILSESFWSKLFEMSTFKLSICTNGTFVLQDYHEKFSEFIREIIIHCVQELTDDIHPKILKLIRSLAPYKIVPNIVVHDQNADHLDEFLERYPDIEFSIFFTDGSFETFHSTEPYRYAIQRESAVVIMKALKQRKYEKYLNKITLAIIKNDFKYLNDWSNVNRELKA